MERRSVLAARPSSRGPLGLAAARGGRLLVTRPPCARARAVQRGGPSVVTSACASAPGRSGEGVASPCALALRTSSSLAPAPATGPEVIEVVQGRGSAGRPGRLDPTPSRRASSASRSASRGRHPAEHQLDRLLLQGRGELRVHHLAVPDRAEHAARTLRPQPLGLGPVLLVQQRRGAEQAAGPAQRDPEVVDALEVPSATIASVRRTCSAARRDGPAHRRTSSSPMSLLRSFASGG